MKIEWLNDEMTRARLIRKRWFRPAETATVKRKDYPAWTYENGQEVDGSVDNDGIFGACRYFGTLGSLEGRREAALEATESRVRAERIESNWRPVVKLPVAKVVTGKRE